MKHSFKRYIREEQHKCMNLYSFTYNDAAKPYQQKINGTFL